MIRPRAPSISSPALSEGPSSQHPHQVPLSHRFSRSDGCAVISLWFQLAFLS